MGIKQYTRCPACQGEGTDRNAPARETSNGSLIQILRACASCDGHGVVSVTDVKRINAGQAYSAQVTI